MILMTGEEAALCGEREGEGMEGRARDMIIWTSPLHTCSCMYMEKVLSFHLPLYL